jgi:hypothetical protein
MSFIFISYSRADSDYVKKLEQRLVSEGFTVWLDKHGHSGSHWWATLKDKLNRCAAVIVLMSEASSKSIWVMRETAIADFLEKPVFPLMLTGDIKEDAWSFYTFRNYTDVSNLALPSNAFYEDLGRVVPRQKILGGVRIDGIYLFRPANSKLCEALRFYSNQSVSHFMMNANIDIDNSLGSDKEAIVYRLAEDEICFEKGGRSLFCKQKDATLAVRVEYPQGRPDFRAYEFVPFE